MIQCISIQSEYLSEFQFNSIMLTQVFNWVSHYQMNQSNTFHVQNHRKT